MTQTFIERHLTFPASAAVARSTELFEPRIPFRGSAFRVATILILFAVQGLWMTIRFDTGSIGMSSEILGWFFGIMPMMPRIGISFLVSILFIRRKRIRAHARIFARAVAAHRGWWICWLAQWSVFGVLTVASLAIFGEGAMNSLPGAAWTVVWIAAAAGTCGCFLCALVPATIWWRFACRERRALLAGLVTSFCAAYGGSVFQLLWKPLGDSTFRFVEWLLGFLYTGSIVSDTGRHLLGTEAFYVHIAPECSGYEGIGMISVFVLAFLAVFRHTLRFPRAWLLWPIGVLAIWISNSLRIAALIVIGTEYSSSVALGGFHSQAGWILFNLVSLGLMACALQSKFFTQKATRVFGTTSPIDSYLIPFLVLTALSMLIAALADNAAVFYPLTVIASLCILWMSRNLLRELTWAWSSYAILQGVLVYFLWTGLAWAQARDVSSSPLPSCETISGLAWTSIRVFGAVVTVPIIEELAFRGFFMRRLLQTDFHTVKYRTIPLWAVLVSSLAFGFMHELWIGGIVAGISYASVTRHRDNIADAIQAHAVTNSLLAMTVLVTGASWLW